MTSPLEPPFTIIIRDFPLPRLIFLMEIIKLATDTAELPSSLLYPQLLGDTNAAS